mgnify:CR=1 FL=1
MDKATLNLPNRSAHLSLSRKSFQKAIDGQKLRNHRPKGEKATKNEKHRPFAKNKKLVEKAKEEEDNKKADG